MEQALEISSLPRALGVHEGQEVKASIGKFGPYVVKEKTFVSIPKDAPYTAYTVTLEEAMALIAAKQSGTSNVIMEFGDIQVLRGKFGPYIKQGKDNFPLPKKYKDDPNTLDEAICNEIIIKKMGESAPVVVEKPKKKVAKKK